ncbi:hypothetical protein RHMOL_Rhmol05G0040300 [Rhododendron molle]|uniref:Uncharacterized protein n=1 Tax=Rhododendron molle TaxID=49168 RepID=A0ACC0NLJ2_RHOML|nr:hypothetical protein RHMOL_Rhmol05G0040300 [Rhododendron molle]
METMSPLESLDAFVVSASRAFCSPLAIFIQIQVALLALFYCTFAPVLHPCFVPDSLNLSNAVAEGCKLLGSGAVKATRFLWQFPTARLLLLFYLVFCASFLDGSATSPSDLFEVVDRRAKLVVGENPEEQSNFQSLASNGRGSQTKRTRLKAKAQKRLSSNETPKTVDTSSELNSSETSQLNVVPDKDGAGLTIETDGIIPSNSNAQTSNEQQPNVENDGSVPNSSKSESILSEEVKDSVVHEELPVIVPDVEAIEYLHQLQMPDVQGLEIVHEDPPVDTSQDFRMRDAGISAKIEQEGHHSVSVDTPNGVDTPLKDADPKAQGLLKTAISTGQSKEARLARVCAGLSSRLQEYKSENAQLEELLVAERELSRSSEARIKQLQRDISAAKSEVIKVESNMADALAAKNSEIEALVSSVDALKKQAALSEGNLASSQALREELTSVERRAEEERAAHNSTKMAAMERQVELEHRAMEASTALARIQRTADERTGKAAELEHKVALMEVECASLNQELQDLEARARRGQKKSPEEANQMIQMQAWQEEVERARQGQRDAESKLSSLEASSLLWALWLYMFCLLSSLIMKVKQIRLFISIISNRFQNILDCHRPRLIVDGLSSAIYRRKSINNEPRAVTCIEDEETVSPDNSKEEGVDVRVVPRCRPFTKEESINNEPQAVTCIENEVAVSPDNGPRVFSPKKVSGLEEIFMFDKVFGPSAQQIDIFKAVLPIVNEVFEGFNCTIISYGHTSSGKSYTMEGDYDRSKIGCNGELPQKAGVIPRAVKQIFDKLEHQAAKCTVKVTFLELYSEEITDLLAPEEIPRVPVEDRQKKQLLLVEDGKGGALVKCLVEEIVTSAGQVFDLLEQGWSHTLFSITIHTVEATPDGERIIKCGTLNLVDLAGAREGHSREVEKINKSFLTLGRVINALVEHLKHIPYRHSTLTRLLRDSLGGETKTCIIATVSPSVHCREETLKTLKYAHRALDIRNMAKVNCPFASVALKRSMDQVFNNQLILYKILRYVVYVNDFRSMAWARTVCSSWCFTLHVIEKRRNLVGRPDSRSLLLKLQLLWEYFYYLTSKAGFIHD